MIAVYLDKETWASERKLPTPYILIHFFIYLPGHLKKGVQFLWITWKLRWKEERLILRSGNKSRSINKSVITMETCPWTKWGCVTLSGRTSNLTPLSGTLRFCHLLSLCIHRNEDVHIKNYTKPRDKGKSTATVWLRFIPTLLSKSQDQ